MSKTKKKLNNLLNPKTIPNVQLKTLKIDTSLKLSKTQQPINSSAKFTSESHNFADFLNVKSIFKDVELSQRKHTFNTFLKNEMQHLEDSNASRKNFFFELRQNTHINNYLLMKNLHQKTFTPIKKKGLMFTNELWSENVYKRIVNNSDLKPKIDYIKLNQKIKLFNEIMRELNSAYSKNSKFNRKEQKAIISSIFSQTTDEKEENVDKNNEKPSFLDNLSQKIQEFSNMQNKAETEKFKALIEQKIGVCDIDNQRNLENIRVFRNRLLYSIKEKKFSRDEKTLSKTLSLHRRATLDVSNVSGNNENRQKGAGASIFKTKNGDRSFLGEVFKKRQMNTKIKAAELIKSCDEEKKENKTIKK